MTSGGAVPGRLSSSGMDLPDVLKRAAQASGVHRITTRPSGRRVRVESGGVVLAESDRAIELSETGSPTRYYLPLQDVRADLLTPSATTSHCPFKGDAAYLSAPGAEDAFWVYEAPSQAARPIAGMLAASPTGWR
jgi:uncharacterized protein (DUF427 family)